MIPEIFNLYLSLQLFLVLLAAVFFVEQKWLRRLSFSPLWVQSLFHLSLVLGVLWIALWPELSQKNPFPMLLKLQLNSSAKLGRLESWREAAPEILSYTLAGKHNFLKFLLPNMNPLIFLLVSVGLFRFLLGYRRSKKGLLNLFRRGRRLHSTARLQVLEADQQISPMSFHHKGCGVILLPDKMNRQTWHVAYRHEASHLRSGDSRKFLCLSFFLSLFFPNPAVLFLRRYYQQLQELGCDRKVLKKHRQLSPQLYAKSLIDVARQQKPALPICVSATHFAGAKNQIKERIMNVLNKNDKPIWSSALLVTLGLLLSWGAISAKSLVDDRRLSMEQAQSFAAAAREKSGIPIRVNEEVLYWLNLAAGSERGRYFLRSSLRRMKSYEGMISRKLQAAGIPEALMAVALHESGYQNYDNGSGAGIWAFTPDTARAYGLRVDDELDERFAAPKLTDAAIEYFSRAMEKFSHWHLALLAYNAGPQRVETEMEKSGITDAFELVKVGKSFKNESRHYLPRTMAALIVFHNPELVHD